MEWKRSPCYGCRKSPLRRKDWPAGLVSACCEGSSMCARWDRWFYSIGWRQVCQALRRYAL